MALGCRRFYESVRLSLYCCCWLCSLIIHCGRLPRIAPHWCSVKTQEYTLGAFICCVRQPPARTSLPPHSICTSTYPRAHLPTTACKCPRARLAATKHARHEWAAGMNVVIKIPPEVVESFNIHYKSLVQPFPVDRNRLEVKVTG